MLEMYSTNAIVAKIRSIYGSMLTMDDFREMVSKRSVAEVADYLSRTPRYADILRDIDPNTVHRGLLEQLLDEQNYLTYKRLCEFQGMENRPFYDFQLKKHECRQMISLVNAISCGLQEGFVQALPSYLISDSKIDFLELARCGTVEEAAAKLKGTEYFKLFKSFRRTEEGKTDFTDAEIKLRTNLYSCLIEDAKKSGFGKNCDELLKLIRMEIDAINIINSYRLKAFFGYEPDEIRKAMLPFTQMGKKSMDRLYNCEKPDKMRDLIGSSVYGRYLNETDESIEPALLKRTLTTMKHTLARLCSAPVALYSFMYICDNEIRNIVRVIEGVRYDIDPAVIYSLLIF